MFLIGTVTTKFNKTISVVTTSGPNYIRIVSAIEQAYKDEAVAKIQHALDQDKLFMDEDLDKITQISIRYVIASTAIDVLQLTRDSNMPHVSADDADSHYSVVGYDAVNEPVMEAHVQQDHSKQRVSLASIECHGRQADFD